MKLRWLRRLLLAGSAALLISTPALAQLTTMGIGGGFGSAGGGGYSGPGDVQAFAHYWGLRCYNNAYASNVADIWDTSTGATTETLLTCSAGGTINQTIHTLATTCATSCSVKTLYDQVGSADATWGAVATAPTVSISCTNSKPCMAFATGQHLNTSFVLTLGFTASAYSVGKRTGNAGNYSNLTAAGSSTFQMGWTPSANQMFAYDGGSEVDAAATDNAFHVAVAIFTGTAADSLTIDGGTPVTGAMGSNTLSSNAYVFGLNTGTNLVGAIVESGLIATTASGSLCHNARLYWGSAGSC